MGLDFVELIMAAEEAFGIEIDAEEAANIVTVEDFHSTIISKLSVSSEISCINVIIFNRLRGALMDLFRLTRDQVRLSIPLNSLLPTGDRKDHWIALQDAIQMRLPDLAPPPWVIATGIVGFATAVIALCTAVPHPAVGALILLIAILNIIVFLRLSRSVRNHPPNSCRTVRQCVNSLRQLNINRLAERGHPVSKQEVWDDLREIIVQQLGVKPEDVIPEAHLIRDLGIG